MKTYTIPEATLLPFTAEDVMAVSKEASEDNRTQGDSIFDEFGNIL